VKKLECARKVFDIAKEITDFIKEIKGDSDDISG
jgi:hypothetical protein